MGYEEERDRSGHRRSRRAKPSEMEDDGLTLITDSFTERREDGSHRSGDRSRSGQKAAKRGQTQPGSSRESRNQEKTRTMNRSDIYADPVKLKARRKKKRKIWFILLESVMLIGILCFAGYSYISSRLDLMQRLPWNPDNSNLFQMLYTIFAVDETDKQLAERSGAGMVTVPDKTVRIAK